VNNFASYEQIWRALIGLPAGASVTVTVLRAGQVLDLQGRSRNRRALSAQRASRPTVDDRRWLFLLGLLRAPLELRPPCLYDVLFGALQGLQDVDPDPQRLPAKLGDEHRPRHRENESDRVENGLVGVNVAHIGLQADAVTSP